MRPEELSKRTHLENLVEVACIVEFDSRETAALYVATCCGLRSTFHRAERARPSTASIYRGPSLSPKGICTYYVHIKFIIFYPSPVFISRNLFWAIQSNSSTPFPLCVDVICTLPPSEGGPPTDRKCLHARLSDGPSNNQPQRIRQIARGGRGKGIIQQEQHTLHCLQLHRPPILHHWHKGAIREVALI